MPRFVPRFSCLFVVVPWLTAPLRDNDFSLRQQHGSCKDDVVGIKFRSSFWSP
jgi:hypothetical protein